SGRMDFPCGLLFLVEVRSHTDKAVGTTFGNLPTPGYIFIAPFPRSIKMRIWSLTRAVLLISCTIFTIACGGGNSTPPPPSGGGGNPTPPLSAVSVSIDPASASVMITQTQQFTATVSNATDTTVTWSVNGVAGGDANVGTITSDGIYTAPAEVPSPSQYKV